VKRKDCDGFSSKMEEVKGRLKKLDPDYERYYDVMYRLLDEDDDSS
jgi:hypothetical protein